MTRIEVWVLVSALTHASACAGASGDDADDGAVPAVPDAGVAGDAGTPDARSRLDAGSPDAGADVPPVEIDPPRVRLDFGELEGQMMRTSARRFLRGLWEHVDLPEDEAAGRAEIEARLDRFDAAGIDALFLWTVSRHLAAVRDPARYGETWPLARWDALAAYVEAARARGMDVYLWFSPTYYKDAFRAPELEEHPEWTILDGGEPIPAVDLASEEARAYEVELIRWAAERYRPTGVQLEEPYYTVPVPGSPPFVARFVARFGYDPRDGARAEDVATVKREVMTDFVREVRSALLGVDPSIVLQANGAYDPYATAHGMDVIAWARGGLVDAYVPQVYLPRLDAYAGAVRAATDAVLPMAGVFVGTGIRWWGVDGNAAYDAEIAHVESLDGEDAPSGTITFSYQTLEFAEADLAARQPARLDAWLGATTADDASDPARVEAGGCAAVALDGADDFVTLPPAHALDAYGHGTWTVRLRFGARPTAAWGTIYHRGHQTESGGFVWIYVTPEARVVLQLADGVSLVALESDTSDALFDGAFHDVAVVLDRGARAATFYVDGEPHGVRTHDRSVLPSVRGPAWIGTYGGRVEPESYALAADVSSFAYYREALALEAVRAAALHCD